jgi:hypothetical protein
LSGGVVWAQAVDAHMANGSKSLASLKCGNGVIGP